MTIHRSLWLLLLAVIMMPACAGPPTDSPSQSYRLPFEFEGGHIYLRASLNGAPSRWFILDSGSPYTIVTQTQAQSLGLKSQGPVKIKGIGAQKVPAALASGVTVNLAGVYWDTSQVLVVPPSFFAPLRQYFGRDFSGIIGADLFKQFVVELNYQTETIRLYNPGGFRYQGAGNKIPLKLLKQKPYVQGKMQLAPNQSFKGQLLIDLGSGAALDINEPVTPQIHKWLSRQTALPRLTLGVGGEKAVHIGRMQQFQIGDLTIESPITEFSLGTPKRQQKISGRLGNQIFSQFQVTLDYAHKHLILEPLAQKKMQYDMSGLWLKTEGKPFKQIWVDRVFANSPATKAGLQVGDRILAIDNQTELSLNKARDYLKGPQNTVRKLKIQRANKTLNIQLTLRSLI